MYASIGWGACANWSIRMDVLICTSTTCELRTANFLLANHVDPFIWPRENRHGMPECPHFERTLSCKTGTECLFLHIDPTEKVPSCPHYEKGFCPLGPRCGKKHLRRTLCKFYLAGFCPYGRQCQEGVHPRWPEDLPKPTPPIPMIEEEKEAIWQKLREVGEREEEQERERNRRAGRGGRGRYGPRRRGGYDRWMWINLQIFLTTCYHAKRTGRSKATNSIWSRDWTLHTFHPPNIWAGLRRW